MAKFFVVINNYGKLKVKENKEVDEV